MRKKMPQAGVRLLIKRAIDFGLASGLLVGTAPLLCATFVAIRLSMGGPAVFRQARAGRYGRVFQIYKFRTMRTIDEGMAPDESARLTWLGRLLRRTSIDELPQLFNVIRGDMSLVGPRPLLVDYLPHYSPEHARRHDVLPGITGWAQIHGRNASSWSKRFTHDTFYVDNWSLYLDLLICSKTIWAVVAQRGIDNGGQPMTRFSGNIETEAPCRVC
jgi:sugar transferase EpsL